MKRRLKSVKFDDFQEKMVLAYTKLKIYSLALAIMRPANDIVIFWGGLVHSYFLKCQGKSVETLIKDFCLTAISSLILTA